MKPSLRNLFMKKLTRDERRDMFGVLWVHAGKHRSEDGVLRNFFVEASGEALNVGQSAAPIQQGWYRSVCHHILIL
jgi:hypothetical protein